MKKWDVCKIIDYSVGGNFEEMLIDVNIFPSILTGSKYRKLQLN